MNENRRGRRLFGLGLLFVIAVGASARDAALSGVDSRFLAVRGEVDLYVVVADEDGRLVTDMEAGDFAVREAAGNAEFGEQTRISGISSAGERRDGLAFMMLIDDSGSMYDGPDGRVSPSPDQTKSTMARREARRFLDELGSSLDRAGLAVFGTRYRVLAGPRTDRATLHERLGVSSPPETEDAYTELYAAISEAAATLADQRGRRIVILFSDGENYPYTQRTGRPHPDYGERSHTPQDALTALYDEGVTLYAVRFGPNRDEDLARIAQATGGLVFDVDGEEELTGLYATIRQRVQAEYRLSYRPRPTGAASTRVRVALDDGEQTSVLAFPSGLVFGTPSSDIQALLALAALPIAGLLLFILRRLKAAHAVEGPSLERLRPIGGGSATVALSGGRTIISPGQPGEATVIDGGGSAGTIASPGTIVVEKGRDGRWTAAAADGLTVNNRKVESTVLESGDVLRAGDELIVFDDGEG